MSASVKGMQAFNQVPDQTSGRPGWLEQMDSLVLSGLNASDVASGHNSSNIKVRGHPCVAQRLCSMH